MSSRGDSHSLRYPTATDPVRIQAEAWGYESSPDATLDRTRASRCKVDRQINVSETERMVSLVAGTVLAGAGLAKRSFTGLLVAGIGGALAYRGYSGHCQVYDAAGIDTSETADMDALDESGIQISESLLINKSSDELYQFWRDFERLPEFMSHLKNVKQLDDKRSEWIAKAPSIAGGEVHWTAEIIEDHENNTIAWQTLPGGGIDHRGSVTFTKSPGDRGTIVRVELAYAPPAGQFGRWVAKLFGEEPEQQIRDDLKRFKQLMETGEVASVAGQPRGKCSGVGSFFGN